jgi:putative spermidine/putrescine transport system permease protein
MTAFTWVKPWRRAWLYSATLLVLLFLILPIFIVIPASFSDSKYLAFPPPGYSIKWYKAYFGSSDWLAATRTSLEAALLTVLIATPIGIAAAYAINSFSVRLAKLSTTIVLLPVIIPNILVAIGVFYVYVRFRIVNSMFGIVAAHSLVALPFVAMTILSGLRSFDLRQEQVARSLGAPHLSAFLHVTLPQIRPSVISSALFAFIISLDEIILSLFVAGGENTVLTRRMFVALRDAIDPTVAAISCFFIGASLVLLGVFALTRSRQHTTTGDFSA